MQRPHLIAITGGIGSGKSVVSQLLRVLGYKVYDCDDRAKWVMTHDDLLRQQLIDLFGADTYSADTQELNKPYLASKIFGSQEALQQMNACVHPAVARDLENMARNEALYFYESAILYESGFDNLVTPDEVWTVSAPLETRILRAMRRDNTTREKIMSRIASQLPQEEKERRADVVIYNDDHHSIIQQILSWQTSSLENGLK